MRDIPLSLDVLHQAVLDLRSKLESLGWTKYKGVELRDPRRSWTVRTGYASGEFWVEVRRFDQKRYDLHVSSVEPYESVGRLRLYPRMEQEPRLAIVQLLTECGLDL